MTTKLSIDAPDLFKILQNHFEHEFGRKVVAVQTVVQSATEFNGPILKFVEITFGDKIAMEVERGGPFDR